MKNLKLLKIRCLLSLIGVIILISCSKDESSDKLGVETNKVSDITSSSASSGGNIKNDGGSPVIARGICYGTETLPTLDGYKTSDGTGTGNYISSLEHLFTNTTYYIRAYAITLIDTVYGNEISFKTVDDGTVNDYDGNRYHTLTIGTQVWMVENLRTAKFNDGSEIPLITDDDEWKNLTTPGFSWYNNDMEGNKETYGGLYNSQAVKTGKLCPTGWHVPTNEEWEALFNEYGGGWNAGASLKENGTVHWASPNLGATNASGFTALPGGHRSPVNGFEKLGYLGEYLSSSVSPFYPDRLNNVEFQYNSTIATFEEWAGNYGFSVRCIKNQ